MRHLFGTRLCQECYAYGQTPVKEHHGHDLGGRATTSPPRTPPCRFEAKAVRGGERDTYRNGFSSPPPHAPPPHSSTSSFPIFEKPISPLLEGGGSRQAPRGPQRRFAGIWTLGAPFPLANARKALQAARKALLRDAQRLLRDETHRAGNSAHLRRCPGQQSARTKLHLVTRHSPPVREDLTPAGYRHRSQRSSHRAWRKHSASECDVAGRGSSC